MTKMISRVVSAPQPGPRAQLTPRRASCHRPAHLGHRRRKGVPQGPAQSLRAPRRGTSACNRASSCRSSAQSGSGKSTLLHFLRLARLVRTSARCCSKASGSTTCPAEPATQLRNRVFGFIFQFYHLLPELTLLENVLGSADDPLLGLGILEAAARNFAIGPLKSSPWSASNIALKHRPSEISGGEMQRAAIARAGRPAGNPAGRRADRKPRPRTSKKSPSLLARLNELRATDRS